MLSTSSGKQIATKQYSKIDICTQDFIAVQSLNKTGKKLTQHLGWNMYGTVFLLNLHHVALQIWKREEDKTKKKKTNLQIQLLIINGKNTTIKKKKKERKKENSYDNISYIYYKITFTYNWLINTLMTYKNCFSHAINHLVLAVTKLQFCPTLKARL